MPTSAMAATTAGLTASAGVGAGGADLDARRAWWSRSAAAIWERPALWTQTNRTGGAVVSGDVLPVRRRRVGGVEPPAQPEGDVDQADQDRDLDQRADDAGEGLAGGDAEDADGDGDGELEVVARGGEGERRGARVAAAERAGRARRTPAHMSAK